MATTGVGDHLLEGAAVLTRLAAMSVPPGLRPGAKAFAAAHAAYAKAEKAVVAAKTARDRAHAAMAKADAALDASIAVLARKMIGAGLGTRQNAFEGFSTRTPSELQSLAYFVEARAVRELVDAVLAAKPPADVRAAAKACVANAGAVGKALDAVAEPQRLYAEAITARDALLPDWTKAWTNLRKLAAAAWLDDPKRVAALFAPPGAAGKKKRKKKPAPKPPAG